MLQIATAQKLSPLLIRLFFGKRAVFLESAIRFARDSDMHTVDFATRSSTAIFRVLFLGRRKMTRPEKATIRIAGFGQRNIGSHTVGTGLTNLDILLIHFVDIIVGSLRNIGSILETRLSPLTLPLWRSVRDVANVPTNLIRCLLQTTIRHRFLLSCL